MKALVLAILIVAIPLSARAAEIDPATVQLWDVIHTSDGSVVKGVIVEEIPGTSYRIALVGGGSLVVQTANVVKLTRELNPAFAGGAAAAPSGGAVTATAPTPAIVATSGLRI